MRNSERLRLELSGAEAIILLEDRSAPAADLARVRRRFHDEGYVLRSVRTRHLSRALEGTEFEALCDACHGQLLLVSTDDDPGPMARAARAVDHPSSPVGIRACALRGARVEVHEMAQLPSLRVTRESLCELLLGVPLELLEVLGERREALEHGAESDRPSRAMTRLRALRSRLARRLRGPRGSDDHRSRWSEVPLSFERIFAEVPGVWLERGWRLRAYAFRAGHDGNGIVVAIPPSMPDPPPLGTVEGSLFEPPRPAGSRPVHEAITGDGSLASYLLVSILLRELSEFGALWHGAGWSDHDLVEHLPGGRPWEIHRRLPRHLGARVGRRGADVVVTLWTVCSIGTVRLTRHVDLYPRGTYRPRCTQAVFATAGFGGVH